MTCPFCLSNQVSEILHAKEMIKGTRDVFAYAVCANCGSPYIMAFPDNVAQYYEEYYSFTDNKLPFENSEVKQALVAIYSMLIVRTGLSGLVSPLFRCPSPWQMSFLHPNLQAFLLIGAKASARILDVGCGGGQFVRMLRKFGYSRATGVDPFLTPATEKDYIKRSDIHGVSRSYDLILFNHSLEHMTDPEAALRHCDRILSPGGTVLVQVPNTNSQEFIKYKQHWCWMHAPHHFAIPSRKGLDIMAARCGFEVVDAIGTSRADHYLYSEEYSRDIGDHDPKSVRRALEDGSFDKERYRSLATLAYSLNKKLCGDWICFYLRRS